MAESYIDSNLLAWQKSNVSQSLEGPEAFGKEREDQRKQYEALKQQREQLIGAAEGLQEKYGVKGDAAPSYIHKFLKKSESSGGISNLSTQDIGKFLMTHEVIQKQTEQDAKIELQQAQSQAQRAAAQATVQKSAEDKVRFDAEQKLKAFLDEITNTDIGKPTESVEVPRGVGVKNLKVGGRDATDQEKYMMGVDQNNGEVIDKDKFEYAAKLTGAKLSELLGISSTPEQITQTDAQLANARRFFRDSLGISPEEAFDAGGERPKSVDGKPSPVDRGSNGVKLFKTIMEGGVGGVFKKAFPTGVPQSYKGVPLASTWNWSGGRTNALNDKQIDALQDFFKESLIKAGQTELATLGHHTQAVAKEDKAAGDIAISFEKAGLFETVQQEIRDGSTLASMRYQKAAARFKAQGLTIPIPESAYMMSAVPQTVKSVPEFGSDGRPNGKYQTFINIGTAAEPKWHPANQKTNELKTDTERALSETVATNQLNARTVKGSYGSIEVDGMVTREPSDKSVGELWEALGAVEAFEQNVDGLIELHRNYGPLDKMGLDPRAKILYALKSTLTQAVDRKTLVGPSAVTADDQKKLDELTQNPERWISWFSKEANIEALERLKDIVITKAEIQMRISGVRRPDGQKAYQIKGRSEGVSGKAAEYILAQTSGAKLNAQQQKVVDDARAAGKIK